METKTKLWAVLVLVVLFSMQFVSAQTISAQDKATFDEILKPVNKIYNLVKYISTAIASMVMLFAGASYVISGSDAGKREKSKNMMMYVMIGLVIIWAAPIVVEFIAG